MKKYPPRDAAVAAPPRFPADYHIHTPLCKHAEGTGVEFRDAGAAKGMSEMGFADHIPDPSGFDSKHRMDVEDFPHYESMVRELQREEQPTVLFGVEADYYAGCEPYLLDWMPRYSLDYVIGSVHYIKDWNFDNPAEISVWNSVDPIQVWREYLALITRLVDSGFFDVVGHFDLPKKFGHRLPDNRLGDFIQPVLDRIARAGMAIEINTSGLRRPVKEVYPSPAILSLACQRGIPICFGSDAHRPSEVGADFAAAVAAARAAGYTRSLSFRQRRQDWRPIPDSV